VSKKFPSASAISERTGTPEMTMPTMVTDVCPQALVRQTGTPAASKGARIGNALVAQRVEVRSDDAG
jgi:hypothetical protein